MANKIIVKLGIDSAMYEDDNTIDLTKYATAASNRLREQFPDYKFAVSALEDDNAETEIEFPNNEIEAVQDAVVEIESSLYSDPEMWERPDGQ